MRLSVDETPTVCRVWASRRSGERSYKRHACFKGEVTFASLGHPAVVSGILKNECPILAVLGGRRVGRWCLPWACVRLYLRCLLEGADDEIPLAPSSSLKIRMESLSLKERRSLHFPMRRRKSTVFRLRWVLDSSKRENTLTSVMSLGYRLLPGGQNQGARGEV